MENFCHPSHKQPEGSNASSVRRQWPEGDGEIAPGNFIGAGKLIHRLGYLQVSLLAGAMAASVRSAGAGDV